MVFYQPDWENDASIDRGFTHENLTREKLSPTKSQKLVWSSLLKNLLLCFSSSFNFLLMGVWNWNNPMLTGVKLSLFCQLWQQHHVPQIEQCVRCLGTIIDSPVKLLCPDLRFLLFAKAFLAIVNFVCVLASYHQLAKIQFPPLFFPFSCLVI